MAPVATIKHSKYALFEYPKALGLPLLLLHGDCWSNNLLFTRNDDGTPSNDVLAFLDWQGVFAGNPMFDLATFLSQSADAEVRREAEGFIIDLYFDELSAHLKAAGKEVDFGIEVLVKAYKSVFVAKAMETVINISLIEKTLSSPYEGVREAQMAKMKLRTKLVLEDAVRFIGEVAQDFLKRK
ncbi:Protein C04F6.7 [Aphelenchoides avenae]|nr:Protein C04F6.7 [Aphelenchus avenae]